MGEFIGPRMLPCGTETSAAVCHRLLISDLLLDDSYVRPKAPAEPFFLRCSGLRRAGVAAVVDRWLMAEGRTIRPLPDL